MKRAAPRDAGDADNDDRRHIPRVIRNATDGGYGPAVPLQMARAHRWARYDDVVSALRLLEQAAREDARATVRGLFRRPRQTLIPWCRLVEIMKSCLHEEKGQAAFGTS
nr:uncharacterized protein LOC117833336 [Setaria viridis]